MARKERLHWEDCKYCAAHHRRQVNPTLYDISLHMFLPEKKEISEKLSALLDKRLSRVEAANWAKPIASQFPMNLASFKDAIVDDAFLTIQLSDRKLSNVSPGFYPSSSEYYVSEAELRYWLEVVMDTFMPKVPKNSRLTELHPQDRLNFADYYDLIWHISSEEFTSLTGIMAHASMSDLYYEKYVYFVIDELHHVLITWDMAYGVQKGVVFSNIGNSEKIFSILCEIFGSNQRFSDRTEHH